MDNPKDLWLIGPAKRDFQGNSLPTAREVLQVLQFHIREVDKNTGHLTAQRVAQKVVTDKLKAIWDRERSPIRSRPKIVSQIKRLSYKWRLLFHDRSNESQQAIEERKKFNELMDQEFDIRVGNTFKNVLIRQTSAKYNNPQINNNRSMKRRENKNKRGSRAERKLLRNLWVSGLGLQTDGRILKTAFEAHGRVLGVEVMQMTSEPQPNTYGRVTMANNKMAADCIAKLNGTQLLGHRIKVERISQANLQGGVQNSPGKGQFDSTADETDEDDEQEFDVPNNQEGSSDRGYQGGNRSRDRGDENRRNQSDELQNTQLNLLYEEEERLQQEREELARERARILQEQADLQRFEMEHRAKIEEERSELLKQQRKIEEAKRQLMKNVNSNVNRFRDDREGFSGHNLQNFDVSGMSVNSTRPDAFGLAAAGNVPVDRTPSHQRQQYIKDEFYREPNYEHNIPSDHRYQDSNANINSGGNRGSYAAEAYAGTSRSHYSNNLDNGNRNNMTNSNSMNQRYPDMADNRHQEQMSRNNRNVDQTNNRYPDNNRYNKNNGHGFRSSRPDHEITRSNNFEGRNDAWGTNNNDSSKRSSLGMNSYRNAPRQHHRNDQGGYQTGQNQDRYRPAGSERFDYGRF
ncbi:probable serine/threonine-protein kinase clkA [Uranotaenia lowii]|uniref:probable serine/threonine-protein kinase clkA n=1 Tax=Uranotaenia lowii TaxID=190385 RepID=UPI00247A827B|nr:probable serine/threonine-protein kinase clkA [Uranotaenia lowii]